MRRRLRLVAILFLANITPLYAQETAPGDACTASQLNIIRSAGGPETTGVHRLMRCNGTNWVAIQTNDLNGTDLPSSVKISGDISPAEIISNQIDYNPTGLSTASVLRLSSDDSWFISGLQGGTDGRVIRILNVGTFSIGLRNQDAAAAAANRFAIGADITLNPDQSVSLIYDSTSQRWRAGGLPFDYAALAATYGWKISVGRPNTCATRGNGVSPAFCWGTGTHGNGAASGLQTRSIPVQTDTGPESWMDWVLVETANDVTFSCGIRTNGTAWCWGAAVNGQLGNGTTTPTQTRPVRVQTDTGPGGWSDWVSLDVGGAGYGCGIRTNGTLWCWGDGQTGVLGDGQDTTDRVRPVQVQTDTGPGGWSDWVQISLGSQHSCGIRSNGTAWCWGGGGARLGSNNPSPHNRPIQVHTDTGPGGWNDWVKISAGVFHSCGIRATGTAWCWGSNFIGAPEGQIGDGTLTTRTRPVQVQTDTGPGGWSDWVQIIAADGNPNGLFTCGVRSNGTAWCWGNASNGKLGNGLTTPNRTRPVQVQTDTGPGGWSDWVTIDAGELHACGLRSNGTLWCWGESASGRLGDGQTTTDRLRPWPVGAF